MTFEFTPKEVSDLIAATLDAADVIYGLFESGSISEPQEIQDARDYLNRLIDLREALSRGHIGEEADEE